MSSSLIDAVRPHLPADLLSAYDTASGIVLAQVAVAAKSHEVPAFAPLLAQVQAGWGRLPAPVRCGIDDCA